VIRRGIRRGIALISGADRAFIKRWIRLTDGDAVNSRVAVISVSLFFLVVVAVAVACRRRRLAFTRYLERGCDLLVNIDPREHNSRAQPTERDREKERERGSVRLCQSRPHPSAVLYAVARACISGMIELFFATAYFWHVCLA